MPVETHAVCNAQCASSAHISACSAKEDTATCTATRGTAKFHLPHSQEYEHVALQPALSAGLENWGNLVVPPAGSVGAAAERDHTADGCEGLGLHCPVSSVP